MATDSYLPPVVVQIIGTSKNLVADLAADKALLLDFANTVTNTQLGAESAQFQTDLGAVKTELLNFAREVTNARLGATADPFWTEIAALRVEISAMSPVDINVDANTAAAMAQIAALKGELASVQTDSLITDALGAAGGGGSGGSGLGLLSMLGFKGGGGGGALGFLGALPAMGTLAGLAGFSMEGVLGTSLGVAGSMAGAGLGAGFLGLGALGTGAVGMGTDMAGIGQAAGDIKTYSQLQGNMAQAASVYGKTSTAFKLAQNQYTQWAADLSQGTIKAIAAASQMATAFHAAFDKMTAGAETVGAQIITQAMKVGMTFLPTIGKFAAQNMGIIKQDLQPFFAWLKTAGGSGGLGIFTNLEKVFQSELPTAMHAAEQGFELLAKTITIASKYGGRFIDWINQFLTRMNGATFGKWSKFVNDMIGLFNAWFPLLVKIGVTLKDLFAPAVGLGKQLAQFLTALFGQIDSWLSKTSTKSLLKNLFTAHATMLIKGFGGLLQATLPLIQGFLGAFLQIEAAFRNFVATPVLAGLTDLLKLLEKIPGFTTVVGVFFAGWLVYARAISPVVSGVQDFITGLGGLSAEAAKNASTMAKLGTSLGSFLGFLQKIGTGLSKGVQAVLDFGSSAAKMAAQWGTSAAKMAAQFASSVGSAMATGAKAVGNFVMGVGAKAATFASSTAKMIASGAQWVAQLAVQMAQGVADFAVLIARWVAGAATWIATNVAMAASAAAAFIAENAATLGIIAGLAALVAAAVYVGTHWHQVWTDIKNWFDDAVKFLRSGFGTLVLLITGPIAPLLLLALHWQQIWGDIKNWTLDAFNFIKTHLGIIIPAIATIILGPIAGLVALLATHWNTVKTDAIDIWHDILNFFKGLPGDMLSIGKDIINGLIHGIEDAGKDAVKAVTKVGSDILHGIKSFFGIFSPSTVMKSVGSTTMAGLTNGITNGSKETIGAATKAAQSIIKAFGSLKQLKSDSGALSAVKSMMGTLKSVLTDLSSISQAAKKLNFTALATGMKSLESALPPLLANLKILGKEMANFGKVTTVTKNLKSLQDLFGTFSGVLKSLTTTVKTVAKVNIPADFFVMDTAFQQVSGAMPAFKAALDTMKSSLDKLGKVTATVKGLSGLKNTFKTFGTALMALRAITWKAAGTNIPADFKTLANAATQIAAGLKQVWGKIKSDSSSTWKDISDYIKKVTNTVLKPLQDLATKAKGVGKDLKSAWFTILSDMKATWGKIESYLKDLPAKLTAPFKGLKTQMQQLGAQLMGGLSAGIHQGASGVTTAMTAAVTQAVNAAKSTAQIKSPSGLTRSELGRPLAQGTALGIIDMLPMIQAASNSMVHASIPGVRGLPGSVKGEGGAYGAGGITMQNTFHITVTGAGKTGTQVGQRISKELEKPMEQLVQRLRAGSVR